MVVEITESTTQHWKQESHYHGVSSFKSDLYFQEVFLSLGSDPKQSHMLQLFPGDHGQVKSWGGKADSTRPTLCNFFLYSKNGASTDLTYRHKTNLQCIKHHLEPSPGSVQILAAITAVGFQYER